LGPSARIADSPWLPGATHPFEGSVLVLSNAIAPSKGFADSPELTASEVLAASLAAEATDTFSGSEAFEPSAVFSASELFLQSDSLKKSGGFSGSRTLLRTVPFGASAVFEGPAGGGNADASGAMFGPLSAPMLAGVVGGGGVLLAAIVLVILKCRRPPATEAGNEIEGLLEPEETTFVAEDTQYFVTEANVLNEDNEDGGLFEATSDHNDDFA
jgi:hypothetical protein